MVSMVENGYLQGVEMFLFTDNSTAENYFFTAYLKSEKLFWLILQVRNMDTFHSIIKSSPLTFSCRLSTII